MKLTITKYIDRLKLIKFFRTYYITMTLTEAVYNTDNLPYVFEVSKADGNDIREAIKSFALFSIEEDKEDFGFCNYNLNINPPQEFLDALGWYSSCTEEQKNYIDQIVLWRSRPAVC